MIYARQVLVRLLVLVLLPVNLAAATLEWLTRGAVVLITAWAFQRYDHPPISPPEWRLTWELMLSALLGEFGDGGDREEVRS